MGFALLLWGLGAQMATTPEATLGQLLMEWELWAAELMETHLSYPLLATYRSQHERQSWLAALTTILDVST